MINVTGTGNQAVTADPADNQSSRAEAFKCICQNLQDNGVLMPNVPDPSCEALSKQAGVEADAVRGFIDLFRAA